MDPLVCDNEELSRQNMSCRWVFGVVWQVSVDNQITLLLYYYCHKGIFKDGTRQYTVVFAISMFKMSLDCPPQGVVGRHKRVSASGGCKKIIFYFIERNMNEAKPVQFWHSLPVWGNSKRLNFRLKPSLSYDWQPSPHWIQTLIKPLVTTRPITISYIKLWYAVWLLCSSSLQEGDGNLITILVLLSTL